MVVLTAETCWALNEYWINNKISGIKLVSLYSTSSIYCSENVFIGRIISMRMWPACFRDMNRGNFYLWGTLKDKIYKMYSKNLYTKDNPREREVKKGSKCSVFHFTSRTLMWMNNEYLDDVRGLEAEGYLQLNSNESTDTWAPKLPQQCVARWHGWSSFSLGWASAMFQRMDHAHCLRLLGDLWYSMSFVSGNCCVMFPREFCRMFEKAAAYVQFANVINTIFVSIVTKW